MSDAALARAYAGAVDRGADDAAAALLAEDVELVFPHGSLRGRDAWLELRARRGLPSISTSTSRPPTSPTPQPVRRCEEGSQRWIETGEIANEQELRVECAIADGLITRIEMFPGG